MTKPIDEIFPRDINNEIKEKLLYFSRTIDEFVNFGTHILSWVVSVSKGYDEQLPLTMFLRDMLEKTNSISTLVKYSNIEPSKIILRSVFELTLYIRYLLDDNFEDRSMAFLVCNAKNKIRNSKAFDKDDQSYQRTLQLLDKDEFFDRSSLESISSSKTVIINQNNLLKLPAYARYTKEYERTNKIYKNPPWYGLFGGPKSIRELSLKVNIPFLYDVLYRKWSENVHGTDIINDRIVKSKNSSIENGKVKANLIQINLPKDAQDVTFYALILVLNTYLTLSETKLQHKNREISKWYFSVRTDLVNIGKEKYIKVEF